MIEHFNLKLFLTTTITLITLFGIAVGSLPKLRMNRATISLVGATLLVLTGAITLEQAYDSIDLDTISLLLGMMIINVNLGISGFFQMVASKIIQHSKSPKQLLMLIIFSSGFLSAIFLNDTICLMLTPLIIEITIQLRRNPIPYLIALAASANIGSAATIIGNPQNMIIGISSKISFVKFTQALIIPSIVSLLILFFVVLVIYRKEFVNTKFEFVPEITPRIYKPLFDKCIVAGILFVAMILIGFQLPLAALTSASILLITRRLKPQRVFVEIDWALLVFFSSLFVITGAIEKNELSKKLFDLIEPIATGNSGLFAFTSALLSNVVSNVPAVMLFKPLISQFSNPEKAWLILAMSSTFAGNLTLLGSVANLIVAESAKHDGIKLDFLEYLKVGVIITIISIFIGTVYLEIIYN
ncbi:MAG: anion transporter [Ignavibacteria bacterium]|nr:anion transporter [Ignavibacteria bacterium]